ncbi:MAG: hypothetical protein H7X95_06475 [Deltaproteobacteria bacterium]|nr:hypothetical protein [Deltaproteobacteria bacterium]
MGIDLVFRLSIVPDELSRPVPALQPNPLERAMDGGHDKGSFDGGWRGMVNEFRNHLTIFLAGTNQLSAMLPRAVASEFADHLEDMESSAEFLQTLLTWMDASTGRGSQAICDVSDVLRRAEALAQTGLSSRVSIRIEPRPAGVRNRGVAIECALAALITELGRALHPRSIGHAGVAAVFEVSVSVHPQRGSLSIVLCSGGAQPAEGGWRVSLAKALLTQVGATVETVPHAPGDRGAGFEVRFRFQ